MWQLSWKSLVLLICIWTSSPSAMLCYATVYSKKEAIAIAQQLRDKRILSDLGKTVLISAIQQTKDETIIQGNSDALRIAEGPGLYRAGLTDPNTGNFPLYVELSDVSILNFLAKSFWAELKYRDGSIESDSFIHAMRKQSAISDSIEFEEEMLLQLRVVRSTFKGPKIEAAITTEDSPPDGWRSYYSTGTVAGIEFGLIDASRSTTGKGRTRLLQDLQSIGLVDKQVVEQILPMIRNNSVTIEGRMLQEAASLTSYKTDYPKNKKLELQFAKKLKKVAVISTGRYEQLQSSYQPFELKGKFGLLSFCENSLILQTKNLPLDPQVLSDTLFAIIRKELLPEFSYSNLKASLTLFSNSRTAGRGKPDLNLQFAADGKQYESLIFEYSGFTRLINKWLADRNSPFRLYCAMEPGNSRSFEAEKIGLILLTPRQLEPWKKDAFFSFPE